MDNEFGELIMLCSKIHMKMCELYDKTPTKCYNSYKNDLYCLLGKMDTSIESFTGVKLCKDCKHLKEDEHGIYCSVVGANNKNYDCSKFEKKE